METQTFQAREMKEALALVRRQLGPDAVIVNTRRITNGPLGLLGGSFVEISAYADAHHSEAEELRELRTSAPRSRALAPASPSADLGPQTNAPGLSGANYHKVKLALSRAKRLQEEPQRSTAENIAARPSAAIAAATAGPLARVAPHAALRRRLLGALVPRDLSEKLLSHLRTPASNREGAERELRHQLTDRIGPPAPLCSPGTRVAALVGPTGVGKTTTIAKLATQATIVDGKRVVLISLDDHRIGAMAQLRAYAEVLGIPLHACTNEPSLARALAASREADLVLVDTPGIAPGDPQGFTRLKEKLDRAGETINLHLCLSASTRQEELDRVIALYQRMEPRAIIATKVDEAVAVGTMVSARLTTELPFSFVTTGQMVPEDIEVATASFIVDTLLGAQAQ
jgi:flagellar biosynthesis protein FlhF